MSEASNCIPAASISPPEGPWQQGSLAHYLFQDSWASYCCEGVQGGMDGLRAKGGKPDLAPVTCDVDATGAGAFTANMVAAASVLYCKNAPVLRVMNQDMGKRDHIKAPTFSFLHQFTLV
ncbi:hypothetical protein DKX38_023034 [Salix brachista]|uniref:Uncharacterized protein n=1 Tax=Salix brachista TaxID=2182728 RepID=A0A5N5K6S9_9ROSI|nr:hypothetical protein DKX38_023034 [Salix brachista]